MSAIQAAVFNSGQNIIYAPGLVRGRYSGYAGTSTVWFDTRTPTVVTIVTSPVTFSSGAASSISLLWRGYYRPVITESVTFSTSVSLFDASSYHAVWIGDAARSGYTLGNSLLSGSGSRTGSISLTGGIYYPIRIQLAYSGDDSFDSFPEISFLLRINNSTSYDLFYNSLTQEY